MKDNVLKTRVTPHFTLEIDGEDGNPPKVWKLCYTYGAIALIEDTIGKDLKKVQDWKDLSSGKDFPVIVWGGLQKFNPEAQRLLSDAIFELMFPGVVEAYNKALAEEKTGATADPNADTGTTMTSVSNVPPILG